MTEEMIGRIQRALMRTWDYISADFDELYPDGYTVRDVCEMVLDADRLEQLGEDPEAARELRKLKYEEQMKFAIANLVV